MIITDRNNISNKKMNISDIIDIHKLSFYRENNNWIIDADTPGCTYFFDYNEFNNIFQSLNQQINLTFLDIDSTINSDTLRNILRNSNIRHLRISFFKSNIENYLNFDDGMLSSMKSLSFIEIINDDPSHYDMDDFIDIFNLVQLKRIRITMKNINEKFIDKIFNSSIKYIVLSTDYNYKLYKKLLKMPNLHELIISSYNPNKDSTLCHDHHYITLLLQQVAGSNLLYFVFNICEYDKCDDKYRNQLSLITSQKIYDIFANNFRIIHIDIKYTYNNEDYCYQHEKIILNEDHQQAFNAITSRNSNIQKNRRFAVTKSIIDNTYDNTY